MTQPNPRKQILQLSDIPVGYYHTVMESGHPVRRAWHLQKFQRVLECLPSKPNASLLDVGCFAGSFLSLVPRERFGRQVGVDILPEQIEYATTHFGTDFRSFRYTSTIADIASVEGTFDAATMIEVIEHLSHAEVDQIIRQLTAKLVPGAWLTISTPNYTSAWPLIELLLNRLSDVSYQEQHVTHFNYFNAISKLQRLAPALATHYRPRLKTTTHFLAPFLAVAGLEVSQRASRAVPHRFWRFPLGNLLLLVFERNDKPWP